jgi:hypothetical protein
MKRAEAKGSGRTLCRTRSRGTSLRVVDARKTEVPRHDGAGEESVRGASAVSVPRVTCRGELLSSWIPQIWLFLPRIKSRRFCQAGARGSRVVCVEGK